MEISRHLPQFNNENVLLIVTGDTDAKIFLARNGTLKTLADFEVAKPHYQDREGHFKTRSNDPPGSALRSGAVYENNKEFVLKNFLHEFSAHLKRVTRGEKITRVFLYTPATLKIPIRKILPKNLRDRLELLFEGNFFDLHPFELLNKIVQAKKEKTVVPTSEEAKKILERAGGRADSK